MLRLICLMLAALSLCLMPAATCHACDLVSLSAVHSASVLVQTAVPVVQTAAVVPYATVPFASAAVVQQNVVVPTVAVTPFVAVDHCAQSVVVNNVRVRNTPIINGFRALGSALFAPRARVVTRTVVR